MRLAYVGRRTNKMSNEWEISFAENAPTQFLILRDQMATPDIPNCAAMWTPENIAECTPQFAVEPTYKPTVSAYKPYEIAKPTPTASPTVQLLDSCFKAPCASSGSISFHQSEIPFIY